MIRKYRFKEYIWHGFFDIDSISGKFRRFIGQFAPMKIEDIYWEPFSSFKRWMHLHVIIFMCTMVDMNAFTLKLFLWIPTNHILNIYRVILVGVICIPATKQYYLFASDPNMKKLGAQAWIFLLIIILEMAVVFKCMPDNGLPPMPKKNKYAWTMGLFLYICFSIVMFRNYKKQQLLNKKNQLQQNQKKLN